MSLVDESNNTPDDNTIEAQMHSLNHHHNDDDDDEYLDEEQHEQHHQPPQISQSSRYQRVKQIVTKFSNSQVFGHLLLCGSQLSFAGFCIFVPSSLRVLHPLFFSLIRLGLMSMTMFPVALLVDRNFRFSHKKIDEDEVYTKSWKAMIMGKIPGKYDALWLVFLAASLFSSMSLYTAGVALIGATICAILGPISVVFASFISVALGREGKSLLKFAGIAAAVIGSMSMIIVTSIFGEKKEGEDTKTFLGLHFTIKSLVGVILMIGNTLTWGVYLNVQKTVLDRKIPPMTATAWSTLGSFILSIIPGVILGRGTNWHAMHAMEWTGLIYASLVQGSLNYFLLSYGARLLTPTILAVYSTTSPILSAVSLYLVFGETTTKWSLIGAALITIGVLMVSIAKRRETKLAEAAAALQNDQLLIANTDPHSVELHEMTNVQAINESPTVETKHDD